METFSNKERKYIAISVKHSRKLADPTLWGYKRTADNEERCFGGYVEAKGIDRAELYSLEEFQKAYGNGVCKTDEPVNIDRKWRSKYKNYDTVLVDEQELKQFLKFCGTI